MTFKESRNTRPITLKCGQCIGCRLEKSRQWAMRCVHEASLHEENAFLTLTYSPEHYPADGSLDKTELQRFWKRLRKSLGSKRISYYACGEYGDHTQRAHYHACLFGHNFSDRKILQQKGGVTLYTSKTLADIWGKGNCSIGELNFETAAYTARYVLKKQTGLARKGRGFANLDEETGELKFIQQPFAAMSLNPAIAKNWFMKYSKDLYNADKDYLVMRGQKLKPTSYYDKLYDLQDPEHMAIIKMNRAKQAEGYTDQELEAHERTTRSALISRKTI